MKISAIDLWHIKSPLKRPYHLSKVYGTLTHAQAVFLRITTEDGREGWGEADPQPPFTEEWPGGVMLFLGDLATPRLVGRDAGDFAALGTELDALAPGNPTAKGAVDMALHDLAGQAAGVPVHVLLGGKLRDRIPVLWPLGSGTLEESLEVVAEKTAEGFGTFMIKTGSREVAGRCRPHACPDRALPSRRALHRRRQSGMERKRGVALRAVDRGGAADPAGAAGGPGQPAWAQAHPGGVAGPGIGR